MKTELPFRKFIYRQAYLLLFAAWLFTLSFVFENYWLFNSSKESVRKSIQHYVQTYERDAMELARDSALLGRLYSRQYSKEDFDKVYFKKYGVFLSTPGNLSESSVKFWNTQQIFPTKALLSLPDGHYLESLVNGSYIYVKKTERLPGGKSIVYSALIPVKWNYFVNTDYLLNEFVQHPGIEKEYNISKEPEGEAVKSISGESLFWLHTLNNTGTVKLHPIVIILRLAGYLLILFFIHVLSLWTISQGGKLTGIIFLGVMLFLVRWLSYVTAFPMNFRQFLLFDATIYGANNVLRSLGDLLLNVLFFLWWILFVYRNFWDQPPKKPGTENQKINWAELVIIASGIVALTFIAGHIVKSLVADSNISFSVTEFFSLNIYSVIGFFVLCCIAAGYFFSIQILYPYFSSAARNKVAYQLLSISVSGLFIITLRLPGPYVAFELWHLIWLLLFIWLNSLSQLRIVPPSFRTATNLFWMFFFSVSMSALLVAENRSRELEERRRMADKLSMQSDPSSENLLSIAMTNFRNDVLKDNFYRFRNPLENEKLKDSLINENFSGYLNKYSTRIYVFDADERPLYNPDSTSFNTLNTIIELQTKPTSVPGLYYHEASYEKFYYLSRKTIMDYETSGLVGYIFVQSTPRQYKEDKFYAELFSKNFNTVVYSDQAYAYAIYENNELKSHHNDYPFPVQLNPKDSTRIKNLEYSVDKRDDGNEELWYKAGSNKRVVIVKKQNRSIESLTLFAYLFCTFLLIVALIRLTGFVVQSRFRWSRIRELWQLNIRTQVHTTIISVSAFSFLVIGVSTIWFFIMRYERNNKDKLSRTIQIMQNEVKKELDVHPSFSDSMPLLEPLVPNALSAKVNDISEVHSIDLNIYDSAGNLRIASQPIFYKKGLLSRKIEPDAFYHLKMLKEIQYIQRENVGQRNYLSIYAPVRDDKGKVECYVNIPYFYSPDELNLEISNFLVTIINLNAFIFLIAGLIALLITSRITNSFTLIREKMKDIKLGRLNEAIVWNRNDEIGELVKEYNKMVKQLEASANLLAKSEREGAWREMARQVAHEIKNPLTPMKLSIQHLQKAIDQDLPNYKSISGNVAKTLVEQIDYLSTIATDFSSFANIAHPRFENVDIVHSIQSVVELFSTDKHFDIKFSTNKSPIIIHADRTHLNRLITNLVRNAIESFEGKKKGLILINCFQSDVSVIISIKDNGRGIDPAVNDKIFTPNFTTKSSGTGLGLAICKGIVEQMHGEISFDTKPGEGSVFFINIPLNTF